MPAAVCTLKRRPEFLRIAAKGKKSVTPGLVLQACRHAHSCAPVRYGLTASRRVGGAVQRNRARRRLREAARAVLPVHAAAGHDYVLIARAATVRRPYALIVQDLEKALKKLNLWREPDSLNGATAGQ
jgi:ribonuclease P protein component